MARGSRNVSASILAALTRLGHRHLPLPAPKLRYRVLLVSVPNTVHINKVAVKFIITAWLSNCQPSVPSVDVWDDQRDAVAEVRLIADPTFIEHAADTFPAFTATNCFRIVTGLIAQRERTVYPVSGITVTAGIRN